MIWTCVKLNRRLRECSGVLLGAEGETLSPAGPVDSSSGIK